MTRPYSEVVARLTPVGDVAARMRAVADALWETLSPHGVSWAGFYLPDADGTLTLGPMRNTPACSPIGLHGACGQAYLSRQPLVVRDVAALGENYVACDPRDRSEVVVPLLDGQGECTAVLDLDSQEVGAFDKRDVDGLTHVLRAAGLTA